MTVSEEGDSCVLRDDEVTKDKVGRVVKGMEDLTVEYTCNCWGLFRLSNSCPLSVMEKVESNNGHPLFAIGTVSKRVGVGVRDVEFVGIVREEVVVEDGMMGLDEGYAKTNVKVRGRGGEGGDISKVTLTTETHGNAEQFPFSCYLQVLSADISWYCLKGTWAIVGYFLKLLWSLFLTYPVAVGGLGVVGIVGKMVRRKTRIKKEKLDQVLKMKVSVCVKGSFRIASPGRPFPVCSPPTPIEVVYSLPFPGIETVR